MRPVLVSLMRAGGRLRGLTEGNVDVVRENREAAEVREEEEGVEEWMERVRSRKKAGEAYCGVYSLAGGAGAGAKGGGDLHSSAGGGG